MKKILCMEYNNFSLYSNYNKRCRYVSALKLYKIDEIQMLLAHIENKIYFIQEAYFQMKKDMVYSDDKILQLHHEWILLRQEVIFLQLCMKEGFQFLSDLPERPVSHLYSNL